jgi:hypothetical protein
VSATDRAIFLEAADLARGEPADVLAWLEMRSTAMSYEFHLGRAMGAAQMALATRPHNPETLRTVRDIVDFLIREQP